MKLRGRLIKKENDVAKKRRKKKVKKAQNKKKMVNKKATENQEHDKVLSKVFGHLSNIEEWACLIEENDLNQFEVKSLTAMEVVLNKVWGQLDLIYMLTEDAELSPIYKFSENEIKSLTRK